MSDVASTELPAIPTEERVPVLDLIRGVAILMILPANIPIFSGIRPFFERHAHSPVLGDTVIQGLTLFFVDQKFITLLSLLFGVGLMIQAKSAKLADRPFVGPYLRRMLILFLLGLSHGLLLWYGDILATYALVGSVALFLRSWGRRASLIAAGILMSWTFFWVSLGALQEVLVGQMPQTSMEGMPESLREFVERFSPESQAAIFREGTYGDILLNHALLLVLIHFMTIFFYDSYTLACFLLGKHFFLMRAFQDSERRRWYGLRFALFGLGLGLPLHMVAILAEMVWSRPGLSEAANTLGALPMALGYLAFLLLWDAKGWLPWLRHRLQDVGRLALSNYLFQSVCCALLFYSFGFRLYGQVNRLTTVVMIVCIWLLQLVGSALWLSYFSMGPVEWLWRRLAGGHVKTRAGS